MRERRALGDRDRERKRNGRKTDRGAGRGTGESDRGTGRGTGERKNGRREEGKGARGRTERSGGGINTSHSTAQHNHCNTVKNIIQKQIY